MLVGIEHQHYRVYDMNMDGIGEAGELAGLLPITVLYLKASSTVVVST